MRLKFLSFPLGSYLTIKPRQNIPYSLHIFHLVTGFLIIPSLGLFLLANQYDIRSQEKKIAGELQMEAFTTQLEVSRWVNNHVNAARVVGELGLQFPLEPSPRLQDELKLILALFPDFHNVFLGDSTATTVGFYPPVNDLGQPTIGINFVDRKWFKQLESSLKPVVSDVFQGRGGVFGPIFTISVPIVINGRLSHFGLGAINLEKMDKLFPKGGEHQDVLFSIIDRKGKVVTSTVAARTPLAQFSDEEFSHKFIGSGVFLKVPGNQKNTSIMQNWQGASYYSKLPIAGTSWTLLLEYPLAPLQAYFYGRSIWSLGIVGALFALMIPIAFLITNRLTRPVQSLALVTSDVPRRIDLDEEILWPVSNIQEIFSLTENFSRTAEALRGRIRETRGANYLLEKKVQERTRELDDQRRRLAGIISGTSVGTWEWDVPTGEIVFNERWAEIIGYTLQELAPVSITTWQNHVHSEDLKISEQVLAKHFAGQADSYEVESRMKHKDGSWIWVLDRGKVVSWAPDGRPLMMSGIHLDITERKVIEEKLQESEERFREMFHRHGAIMLLVDPESGAIIDANHSAEKFYGYDHQKLCQLNINEINTLDPTRISEERQKAKREERSYFIFPHKAAKGNIRTVEVHSMPIRLERATVLFSIIHDITERQQMEKDLQLAKSNAIAANMAKSEFLANMSHEIRTPLNGVIGMAQLLASTDLTPGQEKYVHGLTVSGSNLLSLLNDILDLSKVEAGQINLESTRFNLARCIQESVFIQKPIIQNKGLSLSVEVCEDIPETLLGDQLRIKQILLNLLGNAAKFTTQGNIAVTAELVKQDPARAQVRISVRDTGIGIAAGAVDRLFQPFIQEDGSTTRRFGGTGLGLTICRRLAELMGGEITAESQLGEGSCFQVTLPFRLPEEGTPGAQLGDSLGPVWEGEPLRILYADGDEFNLSIGMKLLKNLGHTVEPARNGWECLDALDRGPFDLVVMDLQMPDQNGEEALREIRRRDRISSIPVIALTAFALRGEKDRLLKLGFSGYVSKPLALGELVAEMKKAIGNA